MSRFTVFSDEEIDLIAEAFDAAAGEGAFGFSQPLAVELQDEFITRGRGIPAAYSGGREDPHNWYIGRH